MDIAAWLGGLGFEQYEPAFRANEIDERVLSSLTSEDLREIGVVPIGHRRRLLDCRWKQPIRSTISISNSKRTR